MPPTDSRRTGLALGLFALIVVAAIVALALSRAAGGPSGSGALPSDSTPVDSGDLTPSASPASPILEGLIPQQVNGTTLTTQSGTDATSLSNDPNGRALDAAVLSIGKQPSDLEIAVSYDASSSVDLSIIGFRISSVTPTTLRPIILATWLTTSAPGVTTTDINLSGTPAIQVSYGDEGADEYLFVFKDAVFVVETADQSLATDAVVAITGVNASPGPSESAAPSGAPSPAASPAPSAG
jgi:hypothetical protein